MANWLSVEKRKQIFHLLCEGNGIRSVTRIVGCRYHTVMELQKRYCHIIEFINRLYFKDLEGMDIEADEIRTFVHKKNNLRWIYIAIDKKSKLVLHFHIGKRDANDAGVFLVGLSKKLHGRSQVMTDCLKSYVTAITNTSMGYYPDDARWIDLMRARNLGAKLGKGVNNRIESHNGNVRQHVSRLTRRTRCFSKKQEGLRQQLTLFFFYYNFLKVHTSLKCTPAVLAGFVNDKFCIDNLMDYDTMFTGKITNKSTKSYGVIEPGSKRYDEFTMQAFVTELSQLADVKKGTTRGKYKKRA